MATFYVQLKASTSEAAHAICADAYDTEGPLTTFFATGSSRTSLDSWSTRIASFRTADIVSVRRVAADLTFDAETELTLAH